MWYRKLILILICSGFVLQLSADSRLTNVDSFRHQFLDNVEYCEPYVVQDTLQFLKQGFYSFVNYDHTSTFHKILFCFEPNFMNLPEPDHYKYPVEEFYRIRDIRWLFLFYMERYIFSKNGSRIDKFCQIQLVQIKNHKPIDMWGGKSSENVLMLYQKLIRATSKKTFKKEVILDKIKSPLEFIGYQFEINKVHAAI